MSYLPTSDSLLSGYSSIQAGSNNGFTTASNSGTDNVPLAQSTESFPSVASFADYSLDQQMLPPSLQQKSRTSPVVPRFTHTPPPSEVQQQPTPRPADVTPVVDVRAAGRQVTQNTQYDLRAFDFMQDLNNFGFSNDVIIAPRYTIQGPSSQSASVSSNGSNGSSRSSQQSQQSLQQQQLLQQQSLQQQLLQQQLMQQQQQPSPQQRQWEYQSSEQQPPFVSYSAGQGSAATYSRPSSSNRSSSLNGSVRSRQFSVGAPPSYETATMTSAAFAPRQVMTHQRVASSVVPPPVYSETTTVALPPAVVPHPPMPVGPPVNELAGPFPITEMPGRLPLGLMPERFGGFTEEVITTTTPIRDPIPPRNGFIPDVSDYKISEVYVPVASPSKGGFRQRVQRKLLGGPPQQQFQRVRTVLPNTAVSYGG